MLAPLTINITKIIRVKGLQIGLKVGSGRIELSVVKHHVFKHCLQDLLAAELAATESSNGRLCE